MEESRVIAVAFLPTQNFVWGFAAICNKVRRNFGDAREELLFYFEET